jgi:hypothetical protein
MNEEANDNGQQYVFDPSKSDNIFDKADNQSDEYDPLNVEEFQAIEKDTDANNEANNEADHEDEYNPDCDDWMPDNVDNAITAPCSQHEQNNNNDTYHVHSQHLLRFLPPPTNIPALQGNLISAASPLRMPMDYVAALATQMATSYHMVHTTTCNMNI